MCDVGLGSQSQFIGFTLLNPQMNMKLGLNEACNAKITLEFGKSG